MEEMNLLINPVHGLPKLKKTFQKPRIRKAIILSACRLFLPVVYTGLSADFHN